MPIDPEPSRRTLWWDVTNGVAGDMLLASLLDLGVDIGVVTRAVEAVLPGEVVLHPHQVRRAGLRACKVDVECVSAPPTHRRWADLKVVLEQAADLPPRVRASSIAVFSRLAEAEAAVHGVSPEEVHFHEVGAWDSVADVVGVAAALADLDVGSVRCGPVALGSGAVSTEHGTLPVPTPATLHMAVGWQVRSGGPGELATPTGLALLRTLAVQDDELPPLRVTAVGVGAGSRDPADRPNVVRAVLGETRTSHAGSASMSLLETNVDDLDPRVWPSTLAALLDAGAADAWLAPILMKKGRPGQTLCVLAEPALVPAISTLVYRLVPTLGIRETAIRRTTLDRVWRTVVVEGLEIRVKLGLLDGTLTSVTPEYEDVAAAAESTGLPVRVLLARAAAAAADEGLVPGGDG